MLLRVRGGYPWGGCNVKIIVVSGNFLACNVFAVSNGHPVSLRSLLFLLVLQSSRHVS